MYRHRKKPTPECNYYAPNTAVFPKTLKASNSGLINHQECLYLILRTFVKEIIVKIHFLN